MNRSVEKRKTDTAYNEPKNQSKKKQGKERIAIDADEKKG